MAVPPPLNGQILGPASPLSAGPSPQIIYIQAPGSNLARAGSELIRSLTFGSGAIAVAFVIASAILPEALKPSHVLGNFQADQHVTYLNGVRQAEVDTQAALGLGQNKIATDTLCAGGAAAGSALRANGDRSFSPYVDGFTQFACQMSRNLGIMQQQANH